MPSTCMDNKYNPVPTRQSLLVRLKDWNDQESWKQFFDTYWKLIYSTAIRAGLTDAEAQDVVQETVISVSKTMPTFEYDAAGGSFKSWLLRLTRWRIVDQLRKRPRDRQHRHSRGTRSTKTDTIERVVDPNGASIDALWEAEWEQNLLDVAMERVKSKVDPKLFQAFDLMMSKGWTPAQVAGTLKLNRARVYLAKHRIRKLVQKQIAALRSQPTR